MSYVHVVVRVSRGCPSLLEPGSARLPWNGLRSLFPDALAAVIMPDHAHVVTPTPEPGTRRRLAATLREHARHSGRVHWQSVPPAEVIADRDKLRRSLR